MDVKDYINSAILTPENDVSGELKNPEYCVTFWKEEESDDLESRFSTRRYKCSHATGIMEVISWAEDNVKPKESIAILFIQVCVDEQGERYDSMHLVHGVYPEGVETSPGADFSWTMRKATDA
ncbi:hypothetical protein Clow_01216 [Corynebacterium lowii]|uniref:Uncharacterized protein n=2 Tax=Corynebacterium lowii TaxID=1544413 RepID=A0A0Q0YI29_9CORY|nr:hypothetical protein Clow_01216 [Corynebacterium lowii]